MLGPRKSVRLEPGGSDGPQGWRGKVGGIEGELQSRTGYRGTGLIEKGCGGEGGAPREVWKGRDCGGNRDRSRVAPKALEA